jgi:hypothetical protein
MKFGSEFSKEEITERIVKIVNSYLLSNPAIGLKEEKRVKEYAVDFKLHNFLYLWERF